MTDRKGEGREHIGTTVVSHFILVHAASASSTTIHAAMGVWQRQSRLSWCCVTFPQPSLFLRVQFFRRLHGARPPCTCTSPLRVHVRAPTRRQYTNIRGLVWVSRRKRGRQRRWKRMKEREKHASHLARRTCSSVSKPNIVLNRVLQPENISPEDL